MLTFSQSQSQSQSQYSLDDELAFQPFRPGQEEEEEEGEEEQGEGRGAGQHADGAAGAAAAAAAADVSGRSSSSKTGRKRKDYALPSAMAAPGGAQRLWQSQSQSQSQTQEEDTREEEGQEGVPDYSQSQSQLSQDGMLFLRGGSGGILEGKVEIDGGEEVSQEGEGEGSRGGSRHAPCAQQSLVKRYRTDDASSRSATSSSFGSNIDATLASAVAGPSAGAPGAGRPYASLVSALTFGQDSQTGTGTGSGGSGGVGGGGHHHVMHSTDSMSSFGGPPMAAPTMGPRGTIQVPIPRTRGNPLIALAGGPFATNPASSSLLGSFSRSGSFRGGRVCDMAVDRGMRAPPSQRRGPSFLYTAPGSVPSRFMLDFESLSELGEGVSSRVSLCRHRLTGWLYAIKRPVETANTDKHLTRLLREPQLHSAVNGSPFLVHLYEVWTEDDRVYMRIEYCPGGSLDRFVDKTRRASFSGTATGAGEDGDGDGDGMGEGPPDSAEGHGPPAMLEPGPALDVFGGPPASQASSMAGESQPVDTDEHVAQPEIFAEEDFWQTLWGLANALQHLHSCGVVHLDVRPANAFTDAKGNVKLGDLGNATLLPGAAEQATSSAAASAIGSSSSVVDMSTSSTTSVGSDGSSGAAASAVAAAAAAAAVAGGAPRKSSSLTMFEDAQEGESRYIARELVDDDDVMDLTKVDIFSLGATLYELCRGYPLPSSGALWHAIRDGNLDASVHDRFSDEAWHLLRRMMAANPTTRPSARELVIECGRRRLLPLLQTLSARGEPQRRAMPSPQVGGPKVSLSLRRSVHAAAASVAVAPASSTATAALATRVGFVSGQHKPSSMASDDDGHSADTDDADDSAPSPGGDIGPYLPDSPATSAVDALSAMQLQSPLYGLGGSTAPASAAAPLTQPPHPAVAGGAGAGAGAAEAPSVSVAAPPLLSAESTLSAWETVLRVASLLEGR